MQSVQITKSWMELLFVLDRDIDHTPGGNIDGANVKFIKVDSLGWLYFVVVFGYDFCWNLIITCPLRLPCNISY